MLRSESLVYSKYVFTFTTMDWLLLKFVGVEIREQWESTGPGGSPGSWGAVPLPTGLWNCGLSHTGAGGRCPFKRGSRGCSAIKTHRQVRMSVLRKGAWDSDLHISLCMACSNLARAGPCPLCGILPQMYYQCRSRRIFFFFFLSACKYLRPLSQSRVWSEG